MTVDEMRAALGLGPDVPDEEVVEAYITFLEGEAEPAPVTLITLDEVKAHLKVLHSDEDALIQGYLDAAMGALEGPEGKLRRTLTPKTVTARLDHLPCGPARLPLPPVRSVVAVEVMTASGWSVIDSAAWTFDDGELEAAPGFIWPAPYPDKRGMRIIYTAGYDVLPKPIRAAVMLMVGDLYMNRETTVPTSNAIKVPMSTTVDDLLNGFVVYR